MNKPFIIITGASSGIGAETAKVFSQLGYNLALFARNIKAMEELELANVLCFAVDITDAIEVKKAVQKAEEHFGHVDCLINNAGFGKSGDFTDLTLEEQENMIRVNLLGTTNCIAAVLPAMQTQKSGTIINVSSVADRNARPQLALYAATKAAVKSLTESLRMANAKHGIRFCNIAPAKVLTPMLISANLTDEQIISVADIAKTILWIYQQPQTICVRDLVIAPTYYEA